MCPAASSGSWHLLAPSLQEKEVAMHDVIIVGARVVGSATALLLARAGLKVLVVDRAAFPSDTLSTHQVQVLGVARLARWGVLDAIMAAGTPPTRTVRFDQGAAVFTGRMPACGGVDMMCSPRRTLLEKVLLDAARAAGAEVRENFITEDLLAGDGTVTGIRGQENGSPSVTERAALVIGADGKHSTVARAVGAGSYRVKPPLSMAFYTYWADVPVTGGELYGRPGCAVGAWPTNDGLVMTYLAWPSARFDEFRADPEGNFLHGTPNLPSHLRKPYGPGWALVGDAGLLLDPITGQGISDAFRDAELLAGAVVTGLGGGRPLARALAGYQRARDRAARPMYDFTARLAALSPPAPGEMALFDALSHSQPDADRFIAMLAGVLPVREFMSPRNVVSLVGMRGFARLALGSARRSRPVPGPEPAQAA
jgi:2-polyprenyl-6-methoxyphenol hydroxylase-like FAD-dependent oxidoreductase